MLKNVKLLVWVTIDTPVSAMRLAIAALPVGQATRSATSSRK
jgi:multisubunit Na+/H+ antiporter MnhG subunit